MAGPGTISYVRQNGKQFESGVIFLLEIHIISVATGEGAYTLFSFLTVGCRLLFVSFHILPRNNWLDVWRDMTWHNITCNMNISKWFLIRIEMVCWNAGHGECGNDFACEKWIFSHCRSVRRLDWCECVLHMISICNTNYDVLSIVLQFDVINIDWIQIRIGISFEKNYYVNESAQWWCSEYGILNETNWVQRINYKQPQVFTATNIRLENFQKEKKPMNGNSKRNERMKKTTQLKSGMGMWRPPTHHICRANEPNSIQTHTHTHAQNGQFSNFWRRQLMNVCHFHSSKTSPSESNGWISVSVAMGIAVHNELCIYQFLSAANVMPNCRLVLRRLNEANMKTEEVKVVPSHTLVNVFVEHSIVSSSLIHIDHIEPRRRRTELMWVNGVEHREDGAHFKRWLLLI